MKRLVDSKWFWFAGFVLVYLALRVFWLDGDPGIPAVWEYGYNATDEGYYLSDGKEKFLWGRFVDLSRNEALTYGFSSGTHFLSYLAHLAFGLSIWTWRIPFVLIALVAWIVCYGHLARKSGSLNAFLLCVAFSSLPLCIAYERTACNDVLIGALTVIAYVLATGRSKVRLFAAALVVASTVLVKPSVWILLPIVAAGVLAERKFKTAWIDLGCFLVTALAAIYLFQLFAALAVRPDAAAEGVSMWEIVRRTTTHYPLPNIWDFASHFKGFSAFPRDPSYTLLGVTTPFIFLLPAVLFLRDVATRTFSHRTLLFAALAAYVAAINVMNTYLTHYFTPILMLLPLVVDAAADELARLADRAPGVAAKPRSKSFVLGTQALVAAACAVGLLFLAGTKSSPAVVQQFYSRIYNFPAQNVWGYTTAVLSVFVALTVGGLFALNGLKDWMWNLPVWILSAFIAGSIVFAALPSVEMAPYLKQATDWYFAPMALSLAVASLMLVATLGFAREIRWQKVLPVFSAVAVVLCFVATPNWRAAAGELIRPPTHRHAEMARELAKLIPADAIVIGERSNQMLMSLPIRTATTFAANSDPIPVIKSILKRDPQAKLYALADSQHAYNLQHYREHAKEYRLDLVTTFKMPSFGSGHPADVHLCRIRPAPQAN